MSPLLSVARECQSAISHEGGTGPEGFNRRKEVSGQNEAAEETEKQMLY